MNALIIIISITLFTVLSTIIYNELNDMENRKKFIVIFFEIIICLIFSILILKFSSFGIKYPTDRNKNSVTKILVAIFTPINGIILLPEITKIINEMQNEEKDNDKFNKRLKKIIIRCVVLVIIEVIYLKNIQNGILNIYKMKQ